MEERAIEWLKAVKRERRGKEIGKRKGVGVLYVLCLQCSGLFIPNGFCKLEAVFDVTD